MNKDKMSLSEIRRILERGEWLDNVRDVSPDEPRPWLDELNGAIEAALDKLAEYEDAEKDGRLVRLPCAFGTRVYEVYALRPDGLEELDRTLLWRRKKSCSPFCSTSTCEGGTCAFYDVEKGECQAKFDPEKTWHIRSVRFSPEHIREIAALCYEDIICLNREEAETALKERLVTQWTD